MNIEEAQRAEAEALERLAQIPVNRHLWAAHRLNLDAYAEAVRRTEHVRAAEADAVESGARAIASLHGGSWDAIGEPTRREFRNYARAALAAYRESQP